MSTHPGRRALFRGHTTDVPPESAPPPGQAGAGGIFGALNAEWLRLGALPSTGRALRRWAAAEPVLAGVDTLGELVDRIDTAAGDEEDQLLLALIRLAHGGQQLAGRVVLQAMLPKLARMTRTLRPAGGANRWPEEQRHAAVAVFWEVLCGYPVARRRTRVAANLALDTLHALTRDQRRPPPDIPIDPAEANRLGPGGAGDLGRDPGALTPEADLLEVIVWGVEVAAITAEDATLLARVYAPVPGERGGSAAAAGLGLSPAALRQRCHRARRRLIAAVRADADAATGRVLAASA